MTSLSFISGNRSIGLNQFHFEWCPKYRKAILSNEVKSLIEKSLFETASKYKMIIHTMEVAEDHVHLFLTLPFTMSVSHAFQLLKGRSAYEVFQAFPWLRQILRKGHFWSPGKFCRSISNVTSSRIQSYIENHRIKELNETIEQAKSEASQLKLSGFF